MSIVEQLRRQVHEFRLKTGKAPDAHYLGTEDFTEFCEEVASAMVRRPEMEFRSFLVRLERTGAELDGIPVKKLEIERFPCGP